MTYDKIYRRSIENPEAFWAEAAADIIWHKPWKKVLDDSRAPFYRWFVGGEINTCYNALDRHVEEGHGDSVGLIYDSPLGNAKRTYTFAEMCNATANIAGAR